MKSGAPAARAIADRGVALIESLNFPRAVGGYHALRHEIDPLPLLGALHQKGFRIALPRTGDGTALSFREWVPGAALEQGRFGVWEPGNLQPALNPSIVLVPLLAFDCTGNRLGYGAGFYDASLRDLRSRQPIVAIGIAFDEQEFPEIPREPQDETLNMIVTPSRVIACEG